MPNTLAIASIASIVETLTRIAEPWKDLYGDSKVLSVVVTFLHLASLLIGGGLALATDRATLRVAGGAPTDRERHLAELGLTHRPVVIALGASFVTGALLFFSDVETYAVSLVFWTKMGLVALLLANGFLMMRLEQGLRRVARPAAADDAASWRRLRTSAWLSGALWLLTLLAGTALMSA